MLCYSVISGIPQGSVRDIPDIVYDRCDKKEFQVYGQGDILSAYINL